ncbi:MAG: twin-arginine translocation signal domain-containing protein, partial [Ilumatobacteraceae bacterium]
MPMLDPDISTDAALRLLHQPETDPLALDRRRFLQLVGMGLGAGLVAGPGSSLLDMALPGLDPSAWAAGPIGPDDGVLVVIGMFGGNDGLNTVVPFNDGNYYEMHGSLAIPGAST